MCVHCVINDGDMLLAFVLPAGGAAAVVEREREGAKKDDTNKYLAILYVLQTGIHSFKCKQPRSGTGMRRMMMINRRRERERKGSVG